QAEDGIRDFHVTGVQTCALPIFSYSPSVTRSPPSPPCGSKASAPSLTVQDAPALSFRYVCQPLVVCPSNNNFQPCFFSFLLRVLSSCAATVPIPTKNRETTRHAADAVLMIDLFMLSFGFYSS